MEERKIYVVMGTTGEYSDRTEWPVKAFLDEERAKALVLAATERSKELQASRATKYERPKGVNQYDPSMEMDYTGTEYYLMTVPLCGDETVEAIVKEEEERREHIRAIRLTERSPT